MSSPDGTIIISGPKSISRRLFKALLKKGKEFGYSMIRLETSDFMTSAHKIYHSEGFVEIDQFPGCETPEPYLQFALFMEKKL